MRLEIALFALAAGGCRYDEGIVVKDMHGKVVIPAAAATRILATPDGDAEVTDVRLIGPVYLGLFPAVVEEPLVVVLGLQRLDGAFDEGVQLDQIVGDVLWYGEIHVRLSLCDRLLAPVCAALGRRQQ